MIKNEIYIRVMDNPERGETVHSLSEMYGEQPSNYADIEAPMFLDSPTQTYAGDKFVAGATYAVFSLKGFVKTWPES